MYHVSCRRGSDGCALHLVGLGWGGRGSGGAELATYDFRKVPAVTMSCAAEGAENFFAGPKGVRRNFLGVNNGGENFVSLNTRHRTFFLGPLVMLVQKSTQFPLF